jgi:hypothetical protein
MPRRHILSARQRLALMVEAFNDVLRKHGKTPVEN